MRFTPGWLRDPLLDDATFDGRMPDLLRLASRLFWTPVAVARRMGSLFALHGAQRVLDVGSGPGKACLVAAAAAPAIRFVGVEQRSGLVAIAQGLAASAALGNVEFRCADATRTSLDSFDGAYLFNPFAENLFSEAKRFDHSVELSERRAIGDLLQMEGSLARARPGFLVVTYHGFGGRFSDDYDTIHTEAAGTDVLRVWRKADRPARRGRYLVEVEERIVAEVVKSREKSS